MRISWIIPVYNAGKFIHEAVSSILSNADAGIQNQIILIDDCSTDEETIFSLNSLKELSCVEVLYQSKNGGPARARNHGMRAATGEWLAFLDADDLVAPNSIAARVDAIRKNKEIRWIVGDMLEIREEGKSIHLKNFDRAISEGKEVLTDLFKISDPLKKLSSWGMLPFLGAMMIRKDLYEQVGDFDETLTYGEDLHFCLLLASLADLYWINLPVFSLRRYHESMTKNRLRAAMEAPRASYFCLIDPRLKAVKKEMRWHYAANLRQSSSVFLEHGLRLRSMAYAARSILWSPNDIRGLKMLYRSCLT